MWYDELGFISIGGQCGGPADGGLGDLKVELWRKLLTHCSGPYSDVVDHVALVLRISGPFADFGPAGVERIRHSSKQRVISADIVIPQSVWGTRHRNDLRTYLAEQVRAAVHACIDHLVRKKHSISAIRLKADLEAGLASFLSA